MNSISPSSNCSCGNHLILAPGASCSICMGQVADASADSLTEGGDHYGPDYFEALEDLLSNSYMVA